MNETNNKYKVIFLDIDGVLNGYNFWNMLGWRLATFLHMGTWYRCNTRDPFGIHTEKVRRLAHIINKTGAKVVLSSSWKAGFTEPFERRSQRQQMLSFLLFDYGIEIFDVTPNDIYGRRVHEIKRWLDNHKNEVSNYIILDDERLYLEDCFGDKLISTSSVPRGKIIMGCWYENTGLKRKHVKRAIKKLNEI